MGRQDWETETLIPTHGGRFDEPYAFPWQQGGTLGMSGTLVKNQTMAVAYPINTQIATRHEALGEGTGMGIGSTDDPAYTLQSAHSHAVAYGLPGNWIGRKPENGGNAVEPMHNLSPNLTSTDRHAVSTPMQVRCLTPVECERLQGFPDGYTDIKIKGKPTPDGPRYKALGNSMAVPVMKWIGKRIKQVEEL